MSYSPRRRARTLLLASAIATSLSAALPSLVLAQQTTPDVRPFDIGEHPLGVALEMYSRQSGRQVATPADLQGRSSAVRGSFDSDVALSRLLRGTGWRAVAGADGRYRLVPTQIDGVAAGSVTAPLSVEGVGGDNPSFQGRTAYDQRDLQSIPASHGQITSLLRLNPAVQLDGGASTSNRPGDLKPADISIHGAAFWQNLFTIDGMSVNNDINPANRQFQSVNSSSTELHGNSSQGIALDVSLVERVDVYDSNVPAEYGGFNGGVVDAITRIPSQELHGSLSTTHTRSAWAQYHLDDWKKSEFFNTPAIADGYVRNQPEFDTTTWRVNLEGHLTDTFGLLGSFTRKHSDIYNQRRLNQSMEDAGATLPTFTNVFRRIDNYFVKGVWAPTDRFMLEAVVTHEPQQGEYFNRNALDGEFVMEEGGSNVGVTAMFEGDRVVQTHKLNWSSLEHSRTGGPGWFARWWHSPEISWGQPTPGGLALYGTFGDLHQEQESVGYQGKFEWAPVDMFGGAHRFAVGMGLSQTKAFYQRKQQFTDHGIGALRPTRTCIDANGIADTRHCSTSPVTFPGWRIAAAAGFRPGDGQYANQVWLYEAGRFDVEQNAWTLWAEDDMRLGRARIRAGLRVDGDDYTDTTTVAPRVAFEYDFAEDGGSQLTAGINRYYGRNIFDRALRVGRESLEYTMSRGPDLVWRDPIPAALNSTVLNNLDVPYDDEWTLGFRQIAWDTAFDLKYVKRKGRDQVVTVRRGGPVADPTVRQTFHYAYENIGHSDTDSVSLAVQPLQTFELGGTNTNARFIANWTDVYRSHVDPEGARFGDNFLIEYRGQVIRYNERPVENFARPWTARIVTQTMIPALNLTVGSFLSWRGDYTAARDTGATTEFDGRQISIYAPRDFGTTMTWDLRFAWQNTIGVKQETLFANLDVTNVLNRRNVATHMDDWAGGYEEFELGRHFQLELGYRF
ncbi:TonB-dependent receptor [Luteimonas deserti]|uniref:TonB-dependent receptor plug domain-containing protein n=1 Tax=Luteimonas deserti TaxID=2752306 RepID=A0A7Z0TZR7_9GAMM|nr:TonB-dependent receptor plug domain-containing protein [Luteimonas deserti]NYZ64265.1 TonB-dependent receptor plug domain-containing protein [Luteimonas deserti]